MISAKDRMARLIAAIPWIVSQDGASVEDIAERFDYPRDLLLDDLQNVVFFVGVPPYTPDTLIEVIIDDDMVWISYADWFSRPMKLSGGELLTLLTAGETALSFDNQDTAGALARGLAKLRLVSGGAQVIDVQLGGLDRATLPILRGSADDRVCVDIDYYSFGSNQRTTRRVEPSRFFVADGNWYVGGYCHLAEGDRVFRVDRIESAERTEESFRHPVSDAEPGELFAIDQAQRVTFSMPAARIGVLDGLPLDEAIPDGDGTVQITLPVSSPRWLEQLLLRIGPGVQIADHGDLEVNVETAAERLLLLYGESASGGTS